MRALVTIFLLLFWLRAGAQEYVPDNIIKPFINAQELFDKVWSNDSVVNSFVIRFDLHFLRQEHDTVPGRVIFMYGNNNEGDSNKVIIGIDKIIDTIHFSSADIPMVTMVFKTNNYNIYSRLMKEYPNTIHVASAGMEFDKLTSPGAIPLYRIKVWHGPR